MVTLLAVSAALALVSGHWDGLNSVVQQFFSLFTNHGIWGWVAYFGLASVGIYKLLGMLVKLRGALIATTAVQGATTAVASGMDAGSMTGGFAAGGAAAGASRLSRLAPGVSALVGALGGATIALGLTGIAIVGAGAAAIAMKQDMDSAKKAAEGLRTELAANQKYYNYGGKQLGMVGRLPGDVKNRADLLVYRDQAAAAKKQATDNYNANKTVANLHLMQQANMEYGLSNDAVNVSNKRVNDSFNAVTRTMSIQKQQSATLAQQQTKLKNLQQVIPSMSGAKKFVAQSVATSLAAEIAAAQKVLDSRGKKLQAGIRSMYTGMSKVGELPKLKGNQLNLLTQMTTGMQRFLSQKEIKLVLGVDKSKVPGYLQAAINAAKGQIAKQKFTVKVLAKVGTLFGGKGNDPQKDASAAQSKANQWLSTRPAHIKTNVLPPPKAQLAAIGNKLAAAGRSAGVRATGGIAAGMLSNLGAIDGAAATIVSHTQAALAGPRGFIIK